VPSLRGCLIDPEGSTPVLSSVDDVTYFLIGAAVIVIVAVTVSAALIAWAGVLRALIERVPPPN
jgi:hypothetical protein